MAEARGPTWPTPADMEELNVLDPLGSAIVKTAATGVVRATGWKAKELWERREHEDLVASLQRTTTTATNFVGLLGKVSPDQLTSLKVFLNSAELQHAALILAGQLYLQKAGRTNFSDGHVKQFVRSQVQSKTGLSGKLLAALSEEIFQVLSRSVTGQVEFLLSRSRGVPKETQEAPAEDSCIYRHVTSLAASCFQDRELRGVQFIRKYPSVADRRRPREDETPPRGRLQERAVPESMR